MKQVIRACLICTVITTVHANDYGTILIEREKRQAPGGLVDTLNFQLYQSQIQFALTPTTTTVVSTELARQYTSDLIKKHCFKNSQIINDCKELIDELPDDDVFGGILAAQNTELDRLEKFANRKFFEDLGGKPAAEKIRALKELDREVKIAIGTTTKELRKNLKSANHVSTTALKVAQKLNLGSDAIKTLEVIQEFTEKGVQLADIGLTAARAYAGDITAYFTAASQVISLFSGSPAQPPIEQHILKAVYQVIENQRIISEKLDYAISNIEAIRNELHALHKDVLIVDWNVRHLNRSLADGAFSTLTACYTNASEARKATTDIFDPTAFPYNENAYRPIIHKAYHDNIKAPFMDKCYSIEANLFSPIKQGIGPKNIFYALKGRGNNDDHISEINNFVRAFRSEHPGHILAKLSDLDLIRRARVPATTLSDIDKKLSLSDTYSFGSASDLDIEHSFSRTVNSSQVTLASNILLQTLPYAWLTADGNFEDQGIDRTVVPTLLRSLENSINLNLISSAQEAMFQGDIILPFLYEVLAGGDILNGRLTSELKPSKVAATQIITRSSIIRKNLLMYALYRAYGDAQSQYRLDYILTSSPAYFKDTLLSSWEYFKSGENWTVKMPCLTEKAPLKVSLCNYQLPVPDEFSKRRYSHSAPTNSLSQLRYQSNMLISVIESYHSNAIN